MLHDELLKATDKAHKDAETSGFITDLMSGKLTKRDYLNYLVVLSPIYERMEQLFVQRHSQSLISHFDHRLLDRNERIKQDIANISTEIGIEIPIIKDACIENYLQTLNENLSEVELLAHHYIRYLGDLSGGQAIAKLMARNYQIAESCLNFYDFKELGDIVFYKKRYRDLLNLSLVTSEQKNLFINTVVNIYKLNRNLFDFLQTLTESKQLV